MQTSHGSTDGPSLRFMGARTAIDTVPRDPNVQGRRVVTVVGLLLVGLLASCGGAVPSPAPTVPDAAPTAPSPVSPAPTVSMPAPFVAPSPSQQVYVVAPGDTVARIAATFGVTVASILDANPSMVDPDRMVVGDAIVVPVDTPTVVIEAAPEGGTFTSGYLHLLVGENVSIRIVGDPRWAGEPVEMQVARGDARPFEFTDYGGSAFDAAGRMATTEWTDSSLSTAYRAIVPASASHPALASAEIVIEWGGSGPCPGRVQQSRPLIVAADGTKYELVPGVDDAFNSQWSIVASNIGGEPDSGWQDQFEICWQPTDVDADDEGFLYLALARSPGREMRLLVATPAGIRAQGELGGHFSLDRSPDGTVYAAIRSYDDGECGSFSFRAVAALGSDAKPKDGWPFTTTDLTSMPVFGPDGTVYLAQTTDSGSRIVALAPDGQSRPGWPHALPGSFLHHVCEGTPREPQLTPDGSLFDVFDAGVYMIGPDGRAVSGWPALLPTGTSVALGPRDHTPCCAALDPILTAEGRIYVPRADQRYPLVHDDMLCLLRDGTACPGWPVRLPRPVARFEVDEVGTVLVQLYVASTPGQYPEIAVRPDGSLVHEVRVGETASGIAETVGVSRAALLAANPQVVDPSLIRPGDVLAIPRLGTER